MSPTYLHNVKAGSASVLKIKLLVPALSSSADLIMSKYQRLWLGRLMQLAINLAPADKVSACNNPWM